jgi:hypothetical protein
MLLLDLASASVDHLSGDQASSRDAASRALALAESKGEQRAVAEAHLHLARTFRYVDDTRAEEELERAAEGYDLVSDRAGRARVEIERGMLVEHREGLVQYVAHLERAYLEAMRSADVRLQASCAQWLAMHQAFALGRSGFEQWATQARDVSRRDDVGLEPRLDLAEAALAMFELHPEAGLEAARRSLAAGRDLGLEHVYSNALVVAVDLVLLSGRLTEVEPLLREARRMADRRPTPWLHLQFDLLEARLMQRSGRVEEAIVLLDGVAAHELAEQRVLRRDLAEARAWVSLERGRFGEARALAAEAVAVDDEIGERCAPMRPRLVDVVATVAAGEAPSLGTIAALRAQSRETGLETVAQLATRWLYVDELTRGWPVDLHGLKELDVVECHALDLEIGALASGRWELLLDAAEVWAKLGTTVWHARALLWHAELTRGSAREGEAILATLGSPEGLAETLRSQVRGLRT